MSTGMDGLLRQASRTRLEPTDAQQRAAQLRADYHARARELARDADLTFRARRERLDQLQAEVSRELRRLGAEHLDSRREQARRAERRAFAPTHQADSVVWLQALERLGGLPADEAGRRRAEELYTAAAMVEDEATCRALATVAARRGWGSLVDRYAEERPPVAEAMAELEALRGVLDSPAGRFSDTATFSAVPQVPVQVDRQADQRPAYEQSGSGSTVSYRLPGDVA